MPPYDPPLLGALPPDPRYSCSNCRGPREGLLAFPRGTRSLFLPSSPLGRSEGKKEFMRVLILHIQNRGEAPIRITGRGLSPFPIIVYLLQGPVRAPKAYPFSRGFAPTTPHLGLRDPQIRVPTLIRAREGPYKYYDKGPRALYLRR